MNLDIIRLSEETINEYLLRIYYSLNKMNPILDKNIKWEIINGAIDNLYYNRNIQMPETECLCASGIQMHSSNIEDAFLLDSQLIYDIIPNINTDHYIDCFLCKNKRLVFNLFALVLDLNYRAKIKWPYLKQNVKDKIMNAIRYAECKNFTRAIFMDIEEIRNYINILEIL